VRAQTGRIAPLMHPDPWPEVRRIASERGLDLAPVYELRERAVKDARFVDADGAVGNTALTMLEAGATVEQTLHEIRARMSDALEGGD